MNLTETAMRRPLTIVIAALALVLGSILAVRQMPRDIFPTLGIPTIYVAQPYGGMDPAQMEGYLTYYYEYHFLYITGIEHVESKSIQGAALIKLQFHPGTDMAQAMSETVSYVNRARAFMPPGTVPPFVMRFDAGSVPVGNLVFSSETRTVGEMQDAALNLVRPLFATLPGVSAPPPFGGSARSIVVNLEPDRLRAYNMSPGRNRLRHHRGQHSSALRQHPHRRQIPDGAGEFRRQEHQRPGRRADPHRQFIPRSSCATSATVADGSDIVDELRAREWPPHGLHPGHQARRCLHALRRNLVKANIRPNSKACCPDDVKVSYEFDQSPYVTRAISGLYGRRPGRGAHRLDGAAVSAGLAQRLHRRDQYPAFAARGAARAVGHRTNHQHHDARRPRAGGRHPGG